MDEEKTSDLSNSILSSVKKLVGIPEEDESFDPDVLMNINSAAATLFQLGVLEKPYTVTSKEDVYLDMIPNGTEDVINQVKMYLFYKTKLGFDSSTLTSNVISMIEKMINEAEWRLMITFNPKSTFE